MELTGPSVPKTCRICGAELRWWPNEEGFPVALDAEPALFGTVIVMSGRAQVISADLHQGFRDAGVNMYTTHSATCHK